MLQPGTSLEHYFIHGSIIFVLNARGSSYSITHWTFIWGRQLEYLYEIIENHEK